MPVLDVDFVFSCSCFVPGIQCAIERSTKIMKSLATLVAIMSLKTLRLIILIMKSLFLSDVLIIFLE